VPKNARGLLRRIVSSASRGALSLILLVLVILGRRPDFDTLGPELHRINTDLVVLGIAVMVLQIIVAGLRWQAVIAAQGHRVDSLTTFRIYYVGLFFTTCTPGGIVGDIVRAWQINKSGLTLSAAVSSLVLDRLIVITSLVLASLQAIRLMPPEIKAHLPFGFVMAFVLLALFGAVRALLSLQRLPIALRDHFLIAKMLAFSKVTRDIFLSPLSLLRIFFLALLSQAITCVAIYVLGQAIDINVSLLDFLILTPPVLLITSLPISIGGWGVREGAMVYALSLAGAVPGRALLLSVLVGIVGICVSLPGGVLWMLDRSTNRLHPAGAAE
jgi:glycosyltransferase 2 family protein